MRLVVEELPRPWTPILSALEGVDEGVADNGGEHLSVLALDVAESKGRLIRGENRGWRVLVIEVDLQHGKRVVV